MKTFKHEEVEVVYDPFEGPFFKYLLKEDMKARIIKDFPKLHWYENELRSDPSNPSKTLIIPHRWLRRG